MVKARVVEDTEPQSDPQLTSNVNKPQVTEIVTPKESAVPKGLPPLAELPEPSQEIFDAPSRALETDDHYDEAIHEAPPRKNAKGQWARRRGGARGGMRARAPQSEEVEEVAALTEKEKEAKLESIAQIAAGSLFMIGEMLVGKCMAPDSSERSVMTGAFKEYFRVSGVEDIPPWLGLLGAISVHVGKRWSHPEFAEKRIQWKLASE